MEEEATTPLSRRSRRGDTRLAFLLAMATFVLVVDTSSMNVSIIRINTDARPIALQVALIVPLLAGLTGLFNGFRMMRLPDPRRRAPAKA